ncbi:hypothetical protein MYX76_00305 [Desulfobacterota bacterium AH_259_B03_O07]|nr:hypothetical protein [Desulfobacterota bacterium AH_259_B03_O07]
MNQPASLRPEPVLNPESSVVSKDQRVENRAEGTGGLSSFKIRLLMFIRDDRK